jgi:hypothetical protein
VLMVLWFLATAESLRCVINAVSEEDTL